MKFEIFSALIGLGATLGMWRIYQSVPEEERLPAAKSALWVLAGAFGGSRLGFFLWQPAYLTDSGWKAIQFWEGGFVWPGAVVGAIFASILIALIRRKDVRLLLDQLSPLLPPVAIMTWLACIPAGCGYGSRLPVNITWLTVIDERGVYASRFPNQIVAALFLFFIFYVFERSFTTNRIGLRSGLTWLLFCLHTLLFSLFRADIRPGWKNLPVDVWMVLGFLLVAMIYMIFILKPRIENVAGS